MASVKSPTRKYFAGLSRDSFLLAFSSLFSDISTEMLYPILPIFLTQTLHATGSVVGLVEGIAQAAQNIVQGFSGWLSDKLQKSKAIALAGYLLSALSKPLIGMATVWQGALAGRIADRLGAGSRSAPRDALVAASVAEEHRGRAFGLEGLGDNTGAFLGPLAAVFLLTWLHVEVRRIFFLAVVPGLLAFLMVLLVKGQAAAIPENSKIDAHPGQFPKAYWKYLAATAVFGIGNSSNSFLILQTRELGASLRATILIYAAFNLVAALVSYPAGSLSDRLGRPNIVLLSFLIFGISYLGFALTQNVWVIALWFAFYGSYQGIFRSVGKALASDFVPDRLRASSIGWYNTTVGLLQLLASIVAGLLWDRIGHAAVFLYGAASAAAGSVALLVLVQAKPRNAATTS